jgi:hypothetical protein
MTTTPDIYDLEVERLTEAYANWVANGDGGISPIYDSWQEAEPLFRFCTPSGNVENRGTELCGCLTQIRGRSKRRAWTGEIEAEILADERIPDDESDIRPEHLPVFAEWQRKIDAALNRNPSQCRLIAMPINIDTNCGICGNPLTTDPEFCTACLSYAPDFQSEVEQTERALYVDDWRRRMPE